MTHWNEETADWVHVNFGSLKSESVERLAEEGVLKSKEMTVEGREIGDVHWFEDMMGRIRSQGQSQNKVEWEVVEFSDENTVNTGKRKLDDVTRRQT